MLDGFSSDANRGLGSSWGGGGSAISLRPLRKVTGLLAETAETLTRLVRSPRVGGERERMVVTAIPHIDGPPLVTQNPVALLTR